MVRRGKRPRRNDGGDDPRASTKPKFDLDIGGTDLKKIAVGHGTAVNKRHVDQLKRFLSLMQPEKLDMEVTDTETEVLARPGCSNAVFLEWVKADDSYMLWCKQVSGEIVKFAFHGGFLSCPTLLEVKNPLLAFSDSFSEGKGWRKVKKLLEELFGNQASENSMFNDHLFSFTRAGGIVFFRIFKICPTPPEPASMKLEEVCPTFALKPIAIHRADQTVNMFIDKCRLILEPKCLNLVACDMHNDSSCPSTTVAHTADNSQRLMLPLPAIHPEMFLFNTSCQEFLDRYHVFRRKVVPGTGSDSSSTAGPHAKVEVEYEDITISMKAFIRSLIRHVGDTHRLLNACFGEFTEHNIFVRRGRIIIVGVKLRSYTKQRAMENFARVHKIINRMLNQMTAVPDDVRKALALLIDDPIANYHQMVHNVAWMFAIDRNHMVQDLYEEFMEFLVAEEQVSVTQNLAGMSVWQTMFEKNWLVHACRTYCIPKHAKKSPVAMSQYLSRKATELQLNPADPVHDILPVALDPEDLFNGRQYFGSIRHLFVHLSDTARKEKELGSLTEEKKDLIVSSIFAATLFDIQEVVTTKFPVGSERRSFEWFKRYFASDDDVSIGSAHDEKIDSEDDANIGSEDDEN